MTETVTETQSLFPLGTQFETENNFQLNKIARAAYYFLKPRARNVLENK